MLDFTRSEQLTIRAWYGAMSIDRMAQRLRKPVDAIHAEAARLGLARPSKAVAKAVEANEAKAERLGHRSASQMAEQARARSEVRYQAKLKAEVAIKARMQAEKELAERNAAILAEYPNTDTGELAKKYGLSKKRIISIALQARVHKSDEYRASRNKRNSEHAGNLYYGKVMAMRRATELLRAGDHVGALDVLERALA